MFILSAQETICCHTQIEYGVKVGYPSKDNFSCCFVQTINYVILIEVIEFPYIFGTFPSNLSETCHDKFHLVVPGFRN